MFRVPASFACLLLLLGLSTGYAPEAGLAAGAAPGAAPATTDYSNTQPAPSVKGRVAAPEPQTETRQADESPELEQPKFPGVSNSQILRGGNGEPSVNIYYPAFNNAVVDALIRAWAVAQAEAFEKNAATLTEGNDKPENYHLWGISCEFEVFRPQEAIASIVFNVSTYQGGAHGNVEIVCMNFDLASGKKLELTDIFQNPEKALELMSEWARQELAKELSANADDDLIREGTSPQVENFSALALIPEGVRMEFPPYQVAPWSSGSQEVDMPLEKLLDAGPQKAIWPSIPAPKN